MEDVTLNCGRPDDYGHKLLQKLKSEVEILNRYAGLLRMEGYQWPGLHQIVSRALMGVEDSRRAFHTGLLKCNELLEEPVSINETAFWKAYAASEDGQTARTEADSGKGQTFGKFIKN